MPRARTITELDPERPVDALQILGASRVEATLLATLQENGALGTKEIVDSTGLRQPEVSVGMRKFRRLGWVEAESIPRQGKGRPMHKYHLVAKKTEIRKHYDEVGKTNIDRQKRALSTIKGLF